MLSASADRHWRVKHWRRFSFPFQWHIIGSLHSLSVPVIMRSDRLAEFDLECNFINVVLKVNLVMSSQWYLCKYTEPHRNKLKIWSSTIYSVRLLFTGVVIKGQWADCPSRSGPLCLGPRQRYYDRFGSAFDLLTCWWVVWSLAKLLMCVWSLNRGEWWCVEGSIHCSWLWSFQEWWIIKYL